MTLARGRFNWKLSVAIYLVLELISQQFLAPRVYKKAKDTNVDLCAKQVHRRAARRAEQHTRSRRPRAD